MFDRLQKRFGKWQEKREAKGKRVILDLQPAFWDAFEDALAVSFLNAIGGFTEEEVAETRVAWEKVWQLFDFRQVR